MIILVWNINLNNRFIFENNIYTTHTPSPDWRGSKGGGGRPRGPPPFFSRNLENNGIKCQSIFWITNKILNSISCFRRKTQFLSGSLCSPSFNLFILVFSEWYCGCRSGGGGSVGLCTPKIRVIPPPSPFPFYIPFLISGLGVWVVQILFSKIMNLLYELIF